MYKCNLFLGLSILQNGKIPYFISDTSLKFVFDSVPLTGCLSQLRMGFQKLGIYQVLSPKKCSSSCLSNQANIGL